MIFQMYTRMMDSDFGVYVAAAIREAIHRLPAPAAMHLDHGAGIRKYCVRFDLAATAS